MQALGFFFCTENPGYCGTVCNHSKEETGVQDHAWLYIQFDTCLGYMWPHLKIDRGGGAGEREIIK